MLLFTVGSGDASRNRNQSALTGPKQGLCNCNCVTVAANRQFIWSVALDARLLLGNPSRRLSSALMSFFFLVCVFEGKLKTV